MFKVKIKGGMTGPDGATHVINEDMQGDAFLAAVRDPNKGIGVAMGGEFTIPIIAGILDAIRKNIGGQNIEAAYEVMKMAIEEREAKL